jgi:ferric-dicitrate binding protein FerR (iron transport regulator)
MGAMSEKHEQAFRDELSEDSDRIAPLLRLAAPREAVPSERAQRVKAAVRARWRQQTRARSQGTTIRWALGALATAALMLVGVRLAVRPDRPVPPPIVATIDILRGPVRLIPDLETRLVEPASFQVGDSIRAGSGVDTTTAGRAAVRLAGGAAVRMDASTRLRLLSEYTLVLDEGAIYIDSGADRRAATLEVRTTLGVARDIGTRFEVRLDSSALRVRVRDGLVQLSQDGQTYDAQPGDELTLEENGRLSRRTVPIYGADWDWVVFLSRPFELEGRSLRDFLDWICEENGWQLRFADSAVERKAATTTQHGSIEGLTPEEALSAVLPTTGVEHQLENGVLLIRFSSSDTKP